VTRPTVAHHVDTLEKMQAAASDLFELVVAGKIKPRIDQRFELADVAQAHESLAARKTTGSTVLVV